MPKMTLSPEEERGNLEQSVALANDYSEAAELYDKDGVPKKRVFEPETPIQFRRMLRALQEWDERCSQNILTASRNIQMELKLSPDDRAALSKYIPQIGTRVSPNGTFYVLDYPSPWNEALYQFVRLLNNSQRALVGGPCRNLKKHEDRDHWFIRKTRRPSVFCSPQCAGDATKANERQRAYENKINKAAAAMRNYAKRPARFKELSWQEFVMEDSRPGPKRKPSISKKFLTMAVKSARLTPPKGAA
jgi:hypothetical protein